MSRIEQKFKTLNRPALIGYLMAGDPDYPQALAIMNAMADGGADLIELGMPFTDPVADGPVIQLAGQRALKSGANMVQTLQIVREFRSQNEDTPVILMGYANPVHAYGLDRFMDDAAAAGVDGLLIVDMPPEEDEPLRSAAQTRDIDVIRLITPTTDEKRLSLMLDGAGGFLYYVSIAGITGTASANAESIRPRLEMIRKHSTLPVAVGFGIKTPDDVAAMAQIADGVVVGSVIVKTIAENLNDAGLANAVKTQVSALAGALAD